MYNNIANSEIILLFTIIDCIMLNLSPVQIKPIGLMIIKLLSDENTQCMHIIHNPFFQNIFDNTDLTTVSKAAGEHIKE